MNELLAMFLSEARDLLEEVSKGLLALEERPGDLGVMNRIFRAMHTLKGSSGLFQPQLAGITRLSHAGEDLLDAVRNGHLEFTSDMADILLEGLDRIGLWLEEVEAGRFTASVAEEPSNQLSARLRAFLAKGRQEPPTDQDKPVAPAATTEPPAWSALAKETRQALMAAARQAGHAQLHVMLYTPEPDTFFFGTDPLHLVRQVPDPLHVHVEPVDPWPNREDFDPFQCRLRFIVVVGDQQEEVQQLFRYVENEVSWASVPVQQDIAPPPIPAAAPPSREAFLRLLREQLTILDIPANADELPGRVASMGRVLTNAIRAMGLHGELPLLDKALAEARSQHRFESLRNCILPLLGDSPPATQGDAFDDRPAEGASGNGRAAKILKVDQGRIDRMMDLVGELVVAKNSVPFLAERAAIHHASPGLAQEIMEFYSMINRLTEDLQSAVMQVRMLPVSTIFQRFPRLVRDISRKLGKHITLKTEGEETEADKNIIELLSDPLIHLVRNSLDHGIEDPETRIQAGKSEAGLIRLSSRQEGDRVIIEVTDDGKGIDPEIIRRKAWEKGLIDEQARDGLTDHEVIQLIFAPGFSTAQEVSDLSGRGVGMDVVRSTVQGLGGDVAVESTLGKGSRVRLELPMTMAISRVMLVHEGPMVFGIPLELVVETVRLPRTQIHRVKEEETTVLRNRLLPLARLSDLLGLSRVPSRREDPENESILVVRPFGEEIGLVVDDFDKGIDIVLKPLDGVLAGLKGYAGGALLGDGRVLLVLNLKELL